MIAALLGNQIVRISLVALVVASVAYAWGRADGRHAGQIEQLQATVKAEAKRKGIENDVQELDRYKLCIAAGGLHDQCDELRRLDPAAEAE